MQFNNQGIRIILVTTHHACCMPLEFSATHGLDYRSLLGSDNLIHWFTENCDLPMHPKMSPIPIGVSYTPLAVVTRHIWGEAPASVGEQESVLEDIVSRAPPFSERIPKCYCNFHFTRHLSAFSDEENERLRVEKLINQELVHFQPKRLQRREMWRNFGT